MSQSIASKRDIAVLATVFADLEYVQQQPHLADGLDRTQRTVNQSLHVVPYYIEKAPSFLGDSESVMSTPGLYQARQWRKSQVLDGVSAAMARGRWQISVRNYQRALSQLVSMVELPCRFFMVCGYLILPAAWCLLQWVVPSGCVRPWELQRYSRPDRGWIMRREDVETPRWFRGLAVRWSGVCRHYFLLLQLFWDATGWGSMESALRCCHHGWWRCWRKPSVTRWQDWVSERRGVISCMRGWWSEGVWAFLDRVHLQEGSWRSVLAESLNRCGVFFCILTGRSNRTWVRRELSCAIRLSVVYGSPLIRVVEADHTLEELDLDQAARESITLEGLQRRPAVGLVPWLEKTMVGLRLAVLLILMSCPFFWLFGIWSEQLPIILKMAVCFLLASEFSMLGSWLRWITFSPAEKTRDTQVQRYLLLVLYPPVLLGGMHWLAGVNEAGALSLRSVLIMLVGLVVNLEQRFVLDTRFNDPRRSSRAAPWTVIAGDTDRRLVTLADENWTERIRGICVESVWPCVRLDSLLVFHRGDRLVLQQECIVSGSLPELLVQQLSQQRIVPAIGLLCFRGTDDVVYGAQSESSLEKLRALGVTDAGVMTAAMLPSCLERLVSEHAGGRAEGARGEGVVVR